jgi:thiol:disulfide interchange protein
LGDVRKLGCFGFLALVVAIYVLWIAILYAGIPLALIGGGFAWYLFNQNRDDDSDAGESARTIANIVGVGSVMLGVISLIGNLYSDDGPFAPRGEVAAPSVSSSSTAETSSAQVLHEFTGADCKSMEYDYAQKRERRCSPADSMAGQ